VLLFTCIAVNLGHTGARWPVPSTCLDVSLQAGFSTSERWYGQALNGKAAVSRRPSVSQGFWQHEGVRAALRRTLNARFLAPGDLRHRQALS
jgi:hypothetical protein